MSLHIICLTFLFYTLIFSFAFIFLRRVVGENQVVRLIPISLCFGVSVFVVLLQLLSIAFGIKNATYLDIFLITIGILLLYFKVRPSHEIVIDVSRKQFLLVVLISLLFSFLSAFYLINFDSFDSLAGVIATIAKQNVYPPLSPFCPESPFVYHYGTVLLGSSLVIFSGIEPWNSLVPPQLIFIFCLPFAIFLFLFSATKNFLQSILGTILGCFCANLSAFGIFTTFGQISLSNFLRNFYQIMFFMNESGFAVSSSKAIITPNMAIALPLSVMLFYLCTNKELMLKRYWVVILFTSAFLYFTYEAFWLPVVVAIFLYHVFSTVTKKPVFDSLGKSFFLTLILILSAVLIGGALFNPKANISSLVYFNPRPYIYSWIGFLSYLYPPEWLEKNQVISHTEGLRFYKVPLFSKCFFIEMGLPLVLLPVIFVWILLKKKNLTLLCFLTGGVVSLTIPFLINYLQREIETIRFLVYARFVFSILFGVFIGYLFELRLPKFFTYSLRMILMTVVIITIIPAIVWLLPLKYSESDYRLNKISSLNEKALTWLGKNMKSGDRGLGPFNNRTLFELINLAGVYGVGISKVATFHEETRKTALTTLDPCLLKELKVRWIYLNDDLLTVVPKEMIENLKNEKLLFLRYKCKDDKDTKKIYEFIPENLDKYCTNKTYEWALGRIYDGKFVRLIDSDSMLKIAFNDKEIALKTLEELKKHLDPKEAYWYRVEALKLK